MQRDPETCLIESGRAIDLPLFGSQVFLDTTVD